MTALQVAGNVMMGRSMTPPGIRRSVTPQYGPTLGVRSLREDLAKPVHRPAIGQNLSVIEAHLTIKEGVASQQRFDLPRFKHYFRGEELLPPVVFLMALEMGPAETLNGRTMPFDAEVLMLRDNLVAAYKPLVAKVRQLNAKEIVDLPQRLMLNFTQAWIRWESAWLTNKEVHAVDALQPLAKAILSLEPLLLSVEKERLLPWPRVKDQKVVTLRCLEGFVHALSDLSASVLPSLKRELDPDPRLLLLMDHVLMLRGERSVRSCLQGTSATPEVLFPEQQLQQQLQHVGVQPRDTIGLNDVMTSTGANKIFEKSKGVSVDAYAFKLLGASVGDAVAGGKVEVNEGRPPTLAPLNSQAAKAYAATLPMPRPGAPPPKENELNKRAADHAAELLVAFEGIKDLLLSLKSTLEYIDPNLDKDDAFVATLQRFERAFRRSKRLFLEPENLA
eukprot:TRINITY_DN27450_c0_g2_i1.p1 TRINITY_DN27450_c0_g2~~TRINITY_DN27450_c0_g2_i1.p1  ORF type:complete len:447 (+),score=87.22 TRINITY_DN27450_c0_g2_i1:69-1409(+)